MLTDTMPEECEDELNNWGFTMNETQTILEHLSQPLDNSRVASRDGAGGKKLSYLETHDVITKLNEVFGYDGWRDTMRDFEAVGEKLFRATVDLEVRFGDTWIRHSDVGIGVVVGQNASSESIEKAVKEAVSDALKRAARKLGDQFGNCLYDKEYNRQNPPQSQGQPRQYNAPSQPQQRAPQPSQNAPQRAQPASNGNAPKCKKCGSDMWDNRAKKARGEISERSPDFKCKDKDSCDYVIWPPKPGEVAQARENSANNARTAETLAEWTEEDHAAAYASTYDG